MQVSWNFNDPRRPPSAFKLPVTPQTAVTEQINDNSILVDFGKETFGFVKLHGLKGKGNITILLWRMQRRSIE